MQRPPITAILDELPFLGIQPAPEVCARLRAIEEEAHLESIAAFAAGAWLRSADDPFLAPVGMFVGQFWAMAIYACNGLQLQVEDHEWEQVQRAFRTKKLSKCELTEWLFRRARPLK